MLYRACLWLMIFFIPFASVQAERTPAPYHRGYFSNQYIPNVKNSFRRYLKWRFKRDNQSQIERYKNDIPFVMSDIDAIQNPGERPQITWIGHSTLLVQYKGINILTDPVLFDRASPVTFLGPERYVPMPLDVEELPPIDYVVISHNHYDHLDVRTVRLLKNEPLWLVPIRVKKWLEKNGVTNAKEFNWWESTREDGVTFTSAPAQHWSRRNLVDRYRSLWCSWVIAFDDFTFYFGGDSGYNEHQYKEIRRELGPFDAAAIPIGGYDPHWWVQDIHMTPEEALQAHLDLDPDWSLAIHWGTFPLGDEPIIEPPDRLRKAIAEHAVSADRFEILPIGSTHRF